MNPEENRANINRNEFMGWQCRIRQHAMRHSAGRPSQGMRPEIEGPDGESFGRAIVLINKADSEPYSQQFRHLVLKTQDPTERYDGAMRFFAAAYYQKAHEFDPSLTALFGPGSGFARKLIEAGRCVLRFEEFSQRYEMQCEVEDLAEHDLRYQATYWHNRLFNPSMPAGVHVLALTPNWGELVSVSPQQSR